MTHTASLAFIDIEAVKSALGITDSSADDQLTGFVESVSGAVEDYLGRPVAARNVTESVDGDGTDTLLLKPYLISVTTVVVDDITITSGSPNRIFYPKTGEVRLLNQTFTTGFQNIDLVYRHGWELDDVPTPIKLAAVNWCIHQWLMTDKDRVGVSSKSTPDGSGITYDSAEVPANIYALLNPYRIASFG